MTLYRTLIPFALASSTALTLLTAGAQATETRARDHHCNSKACRETIQTIGPAAGRPGPTLPRMTGVQREQPSGATTPALLSGSKVIGEKSGCGSGKVIGEKGCR